MDEDKKLAVQVAARLASDFTSHLLGTVPAPVKTGEGHLVAVALKEVQATSLALFRAMLPEVLKAIREVS